MDITKNYEFIDFGELAYCPDVGFMYQKDMTFSVAYDKDYFERYVGYEDSEMSIKLNTHRTSITKKYCKSILDMGVGSGEFIKKSTIPVFGYDVNPIAIEWLKEKGLFLDPYSGKRLPMRVEGVSLWDTLEHIKNPGDLLSRFSPGQFVFVSIPIFSDLTKIRSSKHYKPNEHYFYFTEGGLRHVFSDFGFQCVEMSDAETRAGREDILTFVFKKKP